MSSEINNAGNRRHLIIDCPALAAAMAAATSSAVAMAAAVALGTLKAIIIVAARTVIIRHDGMLGEIERLLLTLDPIDINDSCDDWPCLCLEECQTQWLDERQRRVGIFTVKMKCQNLNVFPRLVVTTFVHRRWYAKVRDCYEICLILVVFGSRWKLTE